MGSCVRACEFRVASDLMLTHFGVIAQQASNKLESVIF